MKQSEILANRFQEVILDGTWIANTNYKDQLSQVTWEQANIKIGQLNTIAALTFHINYYVAGVLQVLEGGTLDIRDKYSFMTPAVTSAEEWYHMKRALFNNAENFVAQLKRMSKEQLMEDFVNEKYGTYTRNIEGMIEHCYYHLGQIVTIRKLI